MIVLDASALLAYLFKETGHEQVAQYSGGEVAGVCAASWCEKVLNDERS